MKMQFVNRLFKAPPNININDLSEDQIRKYLADGDIKYDEEILATFKNSIIMCDEIHNVYNSIEKNNLAVLRGYSVTKEQKIIREIINSIMCNYFVDINLISKKYNLTNSELYNSIQFKEDSLEDFILDKILDFDDNKININESGRLFTRNIAMRFDPLIDQKIGTYSNTV